MSDRRTFLVERYIPSLEAAALADLARRLDGASRELRAEGRDVHWLRSFALLDDETCLCVFFAPSGADVEEANRRAQAPYERVVAACMVEQAPSASTVSARPERPPAQSS